MDDASMFVVKGLSLILQKSQKNMMLDPIAIATHLYNLLVLG